jgi:hypothetical protein
MRLPKWRRFVWTVCLVASVLIAYEVQGQKPKELAPECPFLLRDVAESANAVFTAIVEGSSEEELDQAIADYESSLDTYKMGCTSEGTDSENRANSDTSLIIDKAGRFISEVKVKRRGSQMVENARAIQAEVKAYLRSHPAKERNVRGVRTPEGAIIEGNTVRLKKGYEFVRMGKNKVALKRSRGNGIDGEFHCTCSKVDSSCEVIIVGATIVCTKGTCTGSCSMTVVIPGERQKQPRSTQ